MRATISILGLNNFDESIWDNFQVPAQANKEDIIDEILLECSDFELLYPDWDVMHHAIGLWSRKELPIWQRLYDAKEYEYNPLWNVDATIKEIRDVTDNSNYTDNTLGSNAKTGEREGANTENLTENIDETINRSGTVNTDLNETTTSEGDGTRSTTTNNNGSVLHQSNTFNSGEMIDNSKDITQATETQNETTHNEGTEEHDSTGHEVSNSQDVRDFNRTQGINGTNTENTSEQGNYTEDKQGTESRATHDVYDVVRQGNIGVTSSQQLLTEEWEVSQLDPEQYIIDSFKQRFCLLLY